MRENNMKRDMELRARAVKGDEDAFMSLWSPGRSYIKWMLKRFWVRGMEHDDVLQECMLQTWSKTLVQWDPTKGSWRNYSKMAIYRWMVTLIKMSQAKMRTPLNDALQEAPQYEGPVGGWDDLAPGSYWDMEREKYWRSRDDSILSRLAEESEWEKARRDLENLLTPLEKDVFELWMAGYGYADIGGMLDLRRHSNLKTIDMSKCIDNALCRIKTKAEKLPWGSGDYGDRC